jgi:hypothetical protein
MTFDPMQRWLSKGEDCRSDLVASFAPVECTQNSLSPMQAYYCFSVLISQEWHIVKYKQVYETLSIVNTSFLKLKLAKNVVINYVIVKNIRKTIKLELRHY